MLPSYLKITQNYAIAVSRNQQLEADLIEQEEELRASFDTSEKVAENLHILIDTLEKKAKLLQEKLDKQDHEFEKKVRSLQENNEEKDEEFEKKLTSKNKTITKLERKLSLRTKEFDSQSAKINEFENILASKDETIARLDIKMTSLESLKSAEDSSSTDHNENEIVEVETKTLETKTPEAEPILATCSACHETGLHSDGCSNLKKFLEDYIPVKYHHHPMMPFPHQVKKQALNRYFSFFGKHQCIDCKQMELKAY
jgi:DNA repair exonuclease SbcCD ATPase subunit